VRTVTVAAVSDAPEGLEKARARRWWLDRRPIRSLRRAASFIDDVGFALLFPTGGINLPSLFEATKDRDQEPAGLEWGPDAERVWAWKDELPRRGLAWYGRFIRGRASFLSPDLLGDLYPREGRPDDFRHAPLGEDSRRIARVLYRSGALSSLVIREAVGMEGSAGSSRFSRSLTELGRHLVVTNHGTEDEGHGWPSAVLELTARVFSVPAPGAFPERRRRSAHRFLDTMIAVRPHELGNAFGWGAGPAREVLDELVVRGEVIRDGPLYRRLGAAEDR
jgi:hypothetical protein